MDRTDLYNGKEPASSTTANGRPTQNGLSATLPVPASVVDSVSNVRADRTSSALSTHWPIEVVAFVEARGNTRKAAEALGIDHALYALELTQHMQELSEAVRAVTLLDTFELATKTKKVLEIAIGDGMKPEDLVKLYSNTLAQLEKLTDNRTPLMGGATTNNYFGNVDTKVIQALPPHVQAAFMKLREAKPDNLALPEPMYETYEHTDSVDNVYDAMSEAPSYAPAPSREDDTDAA